MSYIRDLKMYTSVHLLPGDSWLVKQNTRTKRKRIFGSKLTVTACSCSITSARQENLMNRKSSAQLYIGLYIAPTMATVVGSSEES